MNYRTLYESAARFAGAYGANNIAEALAILQLIPDAGPIFAQIEKADEMLCHAVQALHAKAAGPELPADPAAMMALALPPALQRRLNWRPPGN